MVEFRVSAKASLRTSCECALHPVVASRSLQVGTCTDEVCEAEASVGEEGGHVR